MSVSAAEYRRRRRQLMEVAGKGAIIIVPSAPERIRNNDAHYPYRQDSDLVYLTGFEEPESVLVLVPGRAAAEAILFCRERDRAREQWDGPRLGPEQAPEQLLVDDAFPIADIDDILPGLIEGRERVYYHFGRDSEFDLRVLGWINRVRAEVRRGARAPHEIIALGFLLHELRLYKSRGEIALMRRAAEIAAEAHTRVLQICRPGLSEFEIEAEILHTFRRHRAVPSYEPIVAGGANACVLHYRANQSELKDGDLLLVDAGAEYACYASDITRTIPVNGRFSPEQRAIYQLVLDAQLAAIAQARPGKHWNDIHDAAVHTLTAGLIQLELLKGSVAKNIKDERYKEFYMHKTGHWIGLDVHDVGDYRIDGHPRLLEPGMVMTVEPGLYIAPDLKHVPLRWRGIGVRIEDDVLVTREGPQVLTAGVVKEIDAIEAAMAAAAAARPPTPARRARPRTRAAA
ncbi:MAG: Xaa-Pro aminopeptidase [Lysobacterales bacterium]